MNMYMVIAILIIWLMFQADSVPSSATYATQRTPAWASSDIKQFDSGLFCRNSRGKLIMEGNSNLKMGGVVGM